MPQLSSNWSAALETNILQYTQDGFAEHSDSTVEVFDVMNFPGGIVRFKDSFGPSILPTSNEGGGTTELAMTDGYPTDAVPQIFKGKIGITEELVRWKKYDTILDRSKALGSAAIQTLNKYANNVFINAFSTSYTEYGDALPLCSTVHTRPDGGATQNNSSTTSIALTETNLETAVIAMREYKSGTGKTLAIGFNENLVLMVPNALDKEAVIITGSTKRNGTPNNDLNWYLGKMSVYVNPWIGSDITDVFGNTGSATAWYLLSRANHGLKFIWDVRPSYKMWEDEDKNTLYTQCYMSGKATWKHPYGFWGSQGDASAYSS